MFLVFIPTPYVDASSAWSFRNKWHRDLRRRGGHDRRALLRRRSARSSGSYTQRQQRLSTSLRLTRCSSRSFTTLVFNANPLLRYDGYYILSDFLEIPNLRQKSTEYSMGLIKRHVFGVKLQQPLPPPLQRFWLFLYAVCQLDLPHVRRRRHHPAGRVPDSDSRRLHGASAAWSPGSVRRSSRSLNTSPSSRNFTASASAPRCSP